MNFQLDVSMILNLCAVALVGYMAKFLRSVDKRLTRIELVLQIKKIIPKDEN